MTPLRLLALLTALWTGTCLALPSPTTPASGEPAPRAADWPPLGCPTCGAD